MKFGIVEKKNEGWSYFAVTVAALLAGLFLTTLEVFFIRSWSTSYLMYLPPFVSGIATVFLAGGIVMGYLKRSHVLGLNALASLFLVSMALCFLVEIVPIAEGNNDSGEIFWFIMLPAIGLFTHASFSYSKLKAHSSTR